jgi:hypothetical protein
MGAQGRRGLDDRARSDVLGVFTVAAVAFAEGLLVLARGDDH